MTNTKVMGCSVQRSAVLRLDCVMVRTARSTRIDAAAAARRLMISALTRKGTCVTACTAAARRGNRGKKR